MQFKLPILLVSALISSLISSGQEKDLRKLSKTQLLNMLLNGSPIKQTIGVLKIDDITFELRENGLIYYEFWHRDGGRQPTKTIKKGIISFLDTTTIETQKFEDKYGDPYTRTQVYRYVLVGGPTNQGDTLGMIGSFNQWYEVKNGKTTFSSSIYFGSDQRGCSFNSPCLPFASFDAVTLRKRD